MTGSAQSDEHAARAVALVPHVGTRRAPHGGTPLAAPGRPFRFLHFFLYLFSNKMTRPRPAKEFKGVNIEVELLQTCKVNEQ